MLKKITLAVALFLLPIAAMNAQELKLGYVNASEIMMAMPEISDYEKQMADFNEQNTKYLQDMEKEINEKYLKFEKEKDSMPESIRKVQEEEINELYKRYQVAAQTLQSEGEKKQQELLKPIQEKLMKAIESVGKKNNFFYIFTTEVLLYKSDKAVDVAPLVKKELGIN